VSFSLSKDVLAGWIGAFWIFCPSLGDPLGAFGKFYAQTFFAISGLISMQFSMGYPNLKSDFWYLVALTDVFTKSSKNRPMGQLEFFACRVCSRLITSDESVSSGQFCREFISLSNAIWIGSNRCMFAEKSEKQEGRLISVKIKATFSDMLNVSSITFQRLYRKTSYLQYILFRPRPIQRQ
jgi:hypothetical protein